MVFVNILLQQKYHFVFKIPDVASYQLNDMCLGENASTNIIIGLKSAYLSYIMIPFLYPPPDLNSNRLHLIKLIFLLSKSKSAFDLII